MDNQFILQACLKDLEYYKIHAEHSPFQELFGRSLNLLGLTDKEVAIALGASIPTITRWRNGTNQPHWPSCGPVYAWLAKQIKNKLT